MHFEVDIKHKPKEYFSKQIGTNQENSGFTDGEP